MYKALKKALFFVWDNVEIINSCLMLANTLRSIGVESVFVTRENSLKSLFSANQYFHISLYSLMVSVSHEVKKWFDNNRFKGIESIFYKGINIWEDLYYEKNCMNRRYRSPLETSYISEMIAKAILYVEAFDNIIKKYKPDYCFIWNGLVYPPKGLRSLCLKKNIPVYYLERGLLPGYLVVDAKGINYDSSLGGKNWLLFSKEFTSFDLKKVESYIEKFTFEKKSIVIQKDYITKEKLYRLLDIPNNKKIVFLPNQIDSDTNIIYYSPFFKTNTDTIKFVIKAVEDIKEAILVIKAHPEDRTRVMENYNLILKDKGRIVFDLNLHSLIEASHVVIVRNSTVGLEALLYNKPVICLGYSAYSGKGFTIDIERYEELHKIIVNILKNKNPEILNKKEFYRFIYILLNNYHFELDDSSYAVERNKKFLMNLLSLDGV